MTNPDCGTSHFREWRWPCVVLDPPAPEAHSLPVQPPLTERSDIRVMIDDVVHMPGLDAPPDQPHPFVYFISIHNESAETVTIRARKWVLRGSNGEVVVVEGQGVVGQTPEIEPGGHFSYNSYHVIGGPVKVTGAFFGETADGEWFFTRIPEFTLEPPRS